MITFESFTVQLVLERTEGKNKDVDIGVVRRGREIVEEESRKSRGRVEEESRKSRGRVGEASKAAKVVKSSVHVVKRE